jgi:chloramphenicol-sensitive protein RarD
LAAFGVLWLTLAGGRLPWVALVLAVSFGFYGLMRKTAALGAIEGLTLETLILAPLAAAGLIWWSQDGSMAGQTAVDWAWLVGTGPVTAGSLLLFAAGARRLPLATLGLVQYVSPSLQFLLGVFLFKEPMDATRLIAFAFIWGALALYSAEGLWQTRRALQVKPI